VEPVAEQRNLADHGAPTLEQLALARLIESGAYDRHLRQARRRYCARRDALIEAVQRHLPGARVSGLAAGLHVVVRLARAVDSDALLRAAAERSVAVYPLALTYMRPPRQGDGLVLGYANLSERAIEAGIRALAAALGDLPKAREPGRPPLTRARQRGAPAGARVGPDARTSAVRSPGTG